MKIKIHKCDICGKEFKEHYLTNGRVSTRPDGGSHINFGHKRFPVCYKCYDKYFAISLADIFEMIHRIEQEEKK